MIKLGSTILNGTPRVAVAFKDGISAQKIQDIETFGLDVVELRIDQYSSFEPSYVLKQVQQYKNLPSIATIRSKKEGGGWKLSEEKRLELFKAILPYVDAIDIELSAKDIISDVIKSAHEHKKLILISYHNFEKTPETAKLTGVLDEAKDLGADMVKIATMAHSRSDVQNLASFTIANKDKNIITIAMGSEGVISRIFFPALGSLLTYAYLGNASAPGQLEYHQTMDLLRLMYSKYNEEKIQALKLLELA